jgi:alpha-amylase/alpha-mannosidase (GH57 family)
LHALKDYYGMVKLLDEFPGVHQTFNLVPSLLAQLEDYVSGKARDPFWEVASKPASELSTPEKSFALEYLFQANREHMIGRYPRYLELLREVQSLSRHARERAVVPDADVTDLQVLSQIAWMDEFFLDEPPIRELIKKGRHYSLEDQQLVIAKQKEFLARVVPAYKSAQDRGSIEISTSPYYHPILPLICDTSIGAVSHPGLPLPSTRFQHPEDAREQMRRGIELHEQTFGRRPRGLWPSEGSVSDEVFSLASQLGIQWLATDEGVLGRSLGTSFDRDDKGCLDESAAETLYQIFRWEREGAGVNVVFRDHSLSDLIGFVYSGAPPRAAAEDFIWRIKESADPIIKKGKDAVVSIILDGENAWESYPQSGREFLRRVYDGLQKDSAFEPLTISEALDRQPSPKQLGSIFPGSWIFANFDVWIGAPEDNLAWDHLSAARDFYSQSADQAAPAQKALAYEELLIAEGSDWNWWYGPEHHSANDRDFDELYRKHLANVYHTLGAPPPHALAEPIAAAPGGPQFFSQSAHIHPLIDGKDIGYFDWLGAACQVADRHTAAMHGKVFLLDAGYAGIDKENLYCRLDFMESPREWQIGQARLVTVIETTAEGVSCPTSRLEACIADGAIQSWSFTRNGDCPKSAPEGSISVCLDTIFECQIPLAILDAAQGSLLRVRFTLWQEQLPIDALPHEGSIEVRVVDESEMSAVPYVRP